MILTLETDHFHFGGGCFSPLTPSFKIVFTQRKKRYLILKQCKQNHYHVHDLVEIVIKGMKKHLIIYFSQQVKFYGNLHS